MRKMKGKLKGIILFLCVVLCVLCTGCQQQTGSALDANIGVAQVVCSVQDVA